MEKLILLLALLLASPVLAEESIQLARVGTMMAGAGVSSTAACADSSCTGFSICQNFETATTGWDNSESDWTEQETNCTIDPAQSATQVLRGTQSVEFIRTGTPTCYITRTLTAAGEWYVHFRYRVSALPSSAMPLLRIYRATFMDMLLSVSLQSSGALKVEQHTGTTYTTVGTLSANTNYHIWAYTKKGATNGEIWVAFSTTTTMPTSGNDYAGGNEATYNNNAGIFRFYGISDTAGQKGYMDQILVKSSSIGDVCD